MDEWENSYSLTEYYEILPKFLTIADSIGFKFNLNTCKIIPYCSVETCNDNIVIDYEGNIYRCWNNVFQKEQVISSFSKSFKCKYLQICEGMYPNIRENIMDNKEENIYNNKCKRIQKQLIKLFIKLSV